MFCNQKKSGTILGSATICFAIVYNVENVLNLTDLSYDCHVKGHASNCRIESELDIIWTIRHRTFQIGVFFLMLKNGFCILNAHAHATDIK